MKKARIKISFIGGGNMGGALIESLIRNKIHTASSIGLFEPDAARAGRFRKKGVRLFTSVEEAARESDVVLLAVKPQHMDEILRRIRLVITKRHLLITIAAGLDSSYYITRLPHVRLIRVMPNLCLTVGAGASALFAAPGTNRNDRTTTTRLFASSGETVWLDDEALLDAVTALSGSGPAFVFFFLHSLIQAGTSVGLSAELSRRLSLQTLRGALRLAETEKNLLNLIGRVASKGGTTEAGLRVLESAGFLHILGKTIEAAFVKAQEIRKLSR